MWIVCFHIFWIFYHFFAKLFQKFPIALKLIYTCILVYKLTELFINQIPTGKEGGKAVHYGRPSSRALGSVFSRSALVTTVGTRISRGFLGHSLMALLPLAFKCAVPLSYAICAPAILEQRARLHLRSRFPFAEAKSEQERSGSISA
ncbi:hypothetical protein A3C05_03435 [Candidatus Giovannonibacteria bacterium RIFCSPHIGHO2_02_FULL_45_40]|uniref:Uncharacterized protein n=1 Tax=Candidatus Giovannonibacteria bacterium RIFCSPHIGHO2_02_FULL_45_40 TaxID=1798337 RepID=A0A1F5WBB8_9BACT|nr:MAG: hypothetical protein A2656_01160 [Candidatus Giovannonibacteria bacterium RIFCSPHIGHO2_01_FULL_44_100]OGF72591.1 MAG: hypothetical protein A3C05_03435 [Candidatus Giovannonibacteria bacterium RIFCSPHIGHO2_02_FULL_45_40]